MNGRGKLSHHFPWRQAVGAFFAAALFGLLQKAGNSNFHELVEIAGGDRKKLNAFEQGIRSVERLVEHSPVELQPGKMPVEK